MNNTKNDDTNDDAKVNESIDPNVDLEDGEDGLLLGDDTIGGEFDAVGGLGDDTTNEGASK
ncbi:MAG TPA: hypothetical protein VIK01_14135 [Polyangiaceae bacterium]